MKLYQSKPRLVFLSNNSIYKFFKSEEECKIEINLVQKSPLEKKFDEKSGYTMNFVKIKKIDTHYYTMEKAKGHPISNLNNYEEFKLAGSWLRVFHSLTYNRTHETVFLFGDYSPSHIYIDTLSKEITTIDPGMGFGEINNKEFDIARFIVSLFQKHSINFFSLKKAISFFLKGYSKENINIQKLLEVLPIRINRNFKKRINLSTRTTRYFSAFYWYIMSILKFYFIKKVI